jgi:hypothetical protein
MEVKSDASRAEILIAIMERVSARCQGKKSTVRVLTPGGRFLFGCGFTRGRDRRCGFAA